MENPTIALAIFNSTAVGDDVDAVYIKAKAYEITLDSIIKCNINL